MSERTQTLKRGETFYGGTPTDAAAHASILGKKFIFNDETPPSGSGIPTMRSGFHVTCMLVQNVSGGAPTGAQVMLMTMNAMPVQWSMDQSRLKSGSNASSPGLAR